MNKHALGFCEGTVKLTVYGA